VFWVALILGWLGALLALKNFYLSFVRPSLHKWKHKDKPYKYISGTPLFGSLLLYASAILFFLMEVNTLALIAFLVSLLDTGGMLWFGIAMLQNRKSSR
jgi:hypothetical protein